MTSRFSKPSRPEVAREEHLRHAAAADGSEELVATKALAHDVMIQYRLVRGLPWLLAIVSAATAARAAPPGHAVAVWWQPPGDLAPAARARAAFADAAQRRGAAFVDATEPARTPPSLVPALDAALADWAAFRFADALAKLDELARLADARGGGDLDQRQLGEIYLYRGLCRLEVGPAEAAWDDLVRAARLDPTRVIDPARFPPRAVAAYRRAAVEVTAARARRARGGGAARRGARARRPRLRRRGDGTGGHALRRRRRRRLRAVGGGGRRLGRARAAAAAVAPCAAARRRSAGGADARRARRGGSSPARWCAAIDGWRFVARELTLPDGKMVSHAVALADTPIAAAVDGAVARVAPLLTAPPPAAAPKKPAAGGSGPSPAGSPRRWRW